MASIKKMLLLLVSLLMILSMAACSRDEEEKETKVPLNKGDANCAHEWSEWETVKASTCTKKGTQQRDCQLCGREEQEAIPAHGHMYYGDECNECGRSAPDCDHAETERVVMAVADCTNRGVEREICSDCMTVVDVHYAPALGHGETKSVMIYQANCTEDGEEHLICTVCGGVAQVNYPGATGHSYVYHDYQSATCTEDGWNSYYSCENCDHLEDYEILPATGHKYRIGACEVCAENDPAFQLISRPESQTQISFLPEKTPISLQADAAQIECFSGTISQSDEVQTYTVTAQRDGRYYVWFKDLGTGYAFSITVKDERGDYVAGYTYCYEASGVELSLTAGVYTVEVSYCYYTGSYELCVGHPKASVDISAYEMVSDKLEYVNQQLLYTFTPAADGDYCFYVTGMQDDVSVDIGVYNSQGENLGVSSYCNNQYGLIVNSLKAGEIYQITVESTWSDTTALNLHISAAQGAVDMAGYSGVRGALHYSSQVNEYTFVAESVEYRMVLTDLTAGVYLKVYNANAELLQSDYIWGSGASVAVSGLEIGQSYIVQICCDYTPTAYTLCLYKPWDTLEIGVGMGIQDSLIYDGQRNVYCFTAEQGGNFYFAMRFPENADASVGLYVYDADGNYVTGDSYFYSHDSLWLENVSIGDVYYIYVEEDYTKGAYILALQ